MVASVWYTEFLAHPVWVCLHVCMRTCFSLQKLAFNHHQTLPRISTNDNHDERNIYEKHMFQFRHIGKQRWRHIRQIYVLKKKQTDDHKTAGLQFMVFSGRRLIKKLNKTRHWRHTHTHPFNGPLSRTTRVGRYQKGKTNLDFTETKDSKWQWHQLGHMQVWTSLQTDNHASTSPLSFLQAGCPSCRPTNSVKALKAAHWRHCSRNIPFTIWVS